VDVNRVAIGAASVVKHGYFVRFCAQVVIVGLLTVQTVVEMRVVSSLIMIVTQYVQLLLCR